AKPNEAQTPDAGLGGVDLREDRGAHSGPRGHATRQARRRRLLMVGQAKLLGDRSDQRLAKARFDQRLANVELRRRAQARTMAAEIIEVVTRRDRRKPLGPSEGVEHLEQLGLAVVAAIARVLLVAGAGDLVGVDQ